ncbi:prepilin-type N-terminal cleavage/methylation domain-containing protein [Candidatus Avelusimicrobium facis]|uniref:prepilin-type N-terminal cleavage/methylation domain-containing protein n=1 Tax=Candidatus Avelusimicrobium facis TaxID=3416203 RepID=UPI003D14ED27
MCKKHGLKKAFTLTELLVVVIVLGVLAAVAVPKFSRVLETRRTTEAEEVLSALRTEQEYRCVQGKNYQMNVDQLGGLASAKNSKNYAYSLTATGAKATSGKGYSISMPSYQNGQLCCEGGLLRQLKQELSGVFFAGCSVGGRLRRGNNMPGQCRGILRLQRRRQTDPHLQQRNGRVE